MAKIKVKNNIDIERNPVERILMKVIEVLKENRKVVLYSLVGLLVALVVLIAASVIIDIQSTKDQVRYEAIMDRYYKNIKDKKTVESTITELKELADSSYFGFSSKMPYYMIGNIYFEQKKFKESREYLLLFTEKSSSEIFLPLAGLKAALALEEMGKLDEALTAMKEVEEKHGEGMLADQILYNTGRIYAIKGDVSKAKVYFNRVIAQFPQSALAGRAKQRLILSAGMKKVK